MSPSPVRIATATTGMSAASPMRTVECWRSTLRCLDPSRKYVAEIYRDGDDANWKTNPYPVTIERKDVTSTSTLKLRLAPGGGTAIRLTPAK